MGYSGFAGIDVAVVRDGRCLVLDLNFRYNASTLPVLLYDAIRAKLGPVVLRSTRWHCPSDPWRAMEREIEERRLIPLGIYDPDGSPFPNRPPFVYGLRVRTSREEP